MQNESIPFISNGLDRIKIGIADVGAPLFNDVIQIHATEQNDKTRLLVSRDKSDVIEVCRQDGQLMQAEINEVFQSDLGVLENRRKKVFEDPISKLFFMNIASSEYSNFWVATATGLLIPNIELLQTFAAVIGENARNKQNKQALDLKRSLGSISKNYN